MAPIHCLGYSYLDEKEGYMLLPDGNGALIYLDDKEGRFNTGYTAVDPCGKTVVRIADILSNVIIDEIRLLGIHVGVTCLRYGYGL